MAKDNSSKESSLDMLRNLLNCPPKDKVTELSNLVLSGSSIIELENRKFYRYQKPDYTSHIICNLQLLGPFWNAQDYEDKVDLCKFVESNLRSQKLSSQSLREEIRGYLYMLMDNFDPHHHESHWRLYGPFWLMEKLQLTDCLDLVLESLRQDAFFYYNYFIGFGEWISALIYQLGRNQLDKLEKFMYEQGLIPGVKPIVFNAILWIYQRHPERKPEVTALVLKFLNHCLDISKKGALLVNLEEYAIGCATAKIREALPILRRMFNEVKPSAFILVNGFDELENMCNTDTNFYCRYDSLNAYLYDPNECYDLDTFDFNISKGKRAYDDDDDEIGYDDSGIYNYVESSKRYIVRIELLDAPEKVERVLQVPSNIYLNPFAELPMLCFGRQDQPEHFEFSDGITRYNSDYTDISFDDESIMDGTDYETLNSLLRKKGDVATFNIMKGKKAAWRHVLTLEKSGRYTDKNEHSIDLTSGQGCYPAKSVRSMDVHAARYHAGKLRSPNFDAIRARLWKFEAEHE